MEDTYKQIINDIHGVMIWCFITGAFVSLMAIWFFSTPSKKKKKKKNACDCKDVNQCEKWCIAKIKFTRDHL